MTREPPTLASTDAEIRAFYASDRDQPKHVEGRSRSPLLREFVVAAAVAQFDCGDVLDVGCGAGHLAALMATCGPEVHVADAVEANVEEAQRRVVRADPTQAPRAWVGLVEDLPFIRRFDAVTCCETIEHVRDPRRAVDRLARAARHLVVLTTPVGTCYDDPSHLHHWDTPEQLASDLALREVFSETLIQQTPSRFGDVGLVFVVLGVPA